MASDSIKTVVIIDDEIDWCLLMKAYLSRFKYTVFCFYTLQEAFPRIYTLKPDIIFLDNNLPDGVGWDKAAELIDKLPELQLNLISAYRNILPAQLSRTDAIRVWEKPVSVKDLDAYFYQTAADKDYN